CAKNTVSNGPLANGGSVRDNLDMDELMSRQRRYLLAAYNAAPENNDEFDIEAVGASLGFSKRESLDIARALEREFDYLTGAVGMPATVDMSGGSFNMTIGLPDDCTTASLTGKGREAARQ